MLSIHSVLKGEDFEDLSMLRSETNEAIQDRVIRRYFMSEGFECENFDLRQPSRDSVYIELLAEGKAPHILSHYGDDMLIRNVPMDIPVFEEPLNRDLPVQIDYPIRQTDSLYYHLPAGYRISHLPAEWSAGSDYGFYTLEVEDQEDRVLIIKNFHLYKAEVPIENYPDFYDFINPVATTERNIKVLLTKENR